MNKQKTTIAIMYDFDKTLSTKDQQEFTFTPEVGMEPADFWKKSNETAKQYKMDTVLAYMHCMLTEAKYKNKSITRDSFVGHGMNLEYYPGVESWFDRINQFCSELGVFVEHYVISCGLREIMEGSSIFGKFKDVFACEYLYDANNIAIWPKNVVNYTTKTQFIYRINKGVLDISDDDNLNKFTPEDDRPIPFRNMIYIGDGITDVPCMKLVKISGGHSIAVYTDKQKVQNLLTHGRVNFIAPADYSEGEFLDSLVKDIITKISAEDKLVKLTKHQHD